MLIKFKRIMPTDKYADNVWAQWLGESEDGDVAVYVLQWRPNVADVLTSEVFSIVGVEDRDFLDSKDYKILRLHLLFYCTRQLDDGRRVWTCDLDGAGVEV